MTRGIEALKFLLEENDLTADDLGDIIGVNRSIAYRTSREPETSSPITSKNSLPVSP